MRWVVLVGVLPAFAMADPLTGTQISAALTARVLGYADSAQQNFFADGRTLYEADRAEWGHWRVEGDRYCSQWPPSDRWTCYGITRDGLDIGFVADDGLVTVGRYIDLQ